MGAIFPSELQLLIGGAKFTLGRIGIVLLLIPAIMRLFSAGRRFLMSDWLAGLTGFWMIGAAVYVDGAGSLSSAGAETLEFVGGYFVARAYVYGPAALEAFVRVLKLCTLIAVGIAVLDNLTGRWFVPDLLAGLLNTPSLAAQYRGGAVRAISTFSHPILFGVFCAAVAAIVLFCETKTARRLLYVFVCLLGSFLSFSSAALMSFALAVGLYFYNWQLCRYRWRWQALIITLFVLSLIVMVSTNHPLGWILTHLTLDAESAYFRLLIWDAALDLINQSPLAGHALKPLNHQILDATTDSAWLVYALRYGIPMTALMVLMNVSAIMSAGSHATRSPSHTAQAPLAFTTVLVVFMFTGLTVAFWNYMWIFWGVCIGVRASLGEWEISRGNSKKRILGDSTLVAVAVESGAA